MPSIRSPSLSALIRSIPATVWVGTGQPPACVSSVVVWWFPSDLRRFKMCPFYGSFDFGEEPGTTGSRPSQLNEGMLSRVLFHFFSAGDLTNGLLLIVLYPQSFFKNYLYFETGSPEVIKLAIQGSNLWSFCLSLPKWEDYRYVTVPGLQVCLFIGCHSIHHISDHTL